MATTRSFATEQSRRGRAVTGASVGLCVGVLLALSANTASAAALGRLTTSVGLLGALAALFVIKEWTSHLPTSVLSTAGAALLIAGGVVWLIWRARAFEGVGALVGGPEASAGIGTPPVSRLRSVTEVLLPSEFKRDPLLADLRRHFERVQHAWDHADMSALGALTTPEMLDGLCIELAGSTGGVRSVLTEIVTLRAELLGFESLPQVFVVSVEFSGLLRESADAGAVPFRELWLLTRSKDQDAAWRLAKHQALI